ncbi:MAG: hypothetical protein GOV15_01320, partial [Candidatus Diapherotrites archaeon]|nr:hypothetical protein [Candidatus Diapherotrites archaeon]
MDKTKLLTVKTHISKITKLTHDAVEISIAIPKDVDFQYKPGQFVMMKIDNPRENKDWFMVKPSHAYNAIKNGSKTVKEISGKLNLDEKTVERFIQKLGDSVKDDNGTCQLTGKECPPDRMPPFQRAYSLGSTPTKSETINTMVKEAPNGFMSKYLTRMLKEGDEVIITGPHGHFTYDESMSKNVVLIGAGSGITPLIGIARYCTDKKLDTKVTLLYSNRTTEDLIYEKELAELENENPNFKVVHTITRPHLNKRDWA